MTTAAASPSHEDQTQNEPMTWDTFLHKPEHTAFDVFRVVLTVLGIVAIAVGFVLYGDARGWFSASNIVEEGPTHLMLEGVLLLAICFIPTTVLVRAARGIRYGAPFVRVLGWTMILFSVFLLQGGIRAFLRDGLTARPWGDTLTTNVFAFAIILINMVVAVRLIRQAAGAFPITHALDNFRSFASWTCLIAMTATLIGSIQNTWILTTSLHAQLNAVIVTTIFGALATITFRTRAATRTPTENPPLISGPPPFSPGDIRFEEDRSMKPEHHKTLNEAMQKQRITRDDEPVQPVTKGSGDEQTFNSALFSVGNPRTGRFATHEPIPEQLPLPSVTSDRYDAEFTLN